MFVLVGNQAGDIEFKLGNINAEGDLKVFLRQEATYQNVKIMNLVIIRATALFNLMSAGFKPKNIVRTIYALWVQWQVWMAGSSIYETGFNALGWARLSRHSPDDQSGILCF